MWPGQRSVLQQGRCTCTWNPIIIGIVVNQAELSWAELSCHQMRVLRNRKCLCRCDTTLVRERFASSNVQFLRNTKAKRFKLFDIWRSFERYIGLQSSVNQFQPWGILSQCPEFFHIQSTVTCYELSWISLPASWCLLDFDLFVDAIFNQRMRRRRWRNSWKTRSLLWHKLLWIAIVSHQNIRVNFVSVIHLVRYIHDVCAL